MWCTTNSQRITTPLNYMILLSIRKEIFGIRRIIFAQRMRSV